MRKRSRWTAVAIAVLASASAVAFAAYEWAESPASQLFGQTLVSGPSNRHVVALTYDDGPNPPYTDAILRVLESEHVRATFFVVGRAVASYPEIVRREIRDGDALGNHTWNHAHMIVMDRAQIDRSLTRTSQAIEAATGVRTTIMRPPYGARDWLVLAESRRLGYTPVMWSVPLADDWKNPEPALVAARILRYVRNGSIIVLHDGNRGLLCAHDHLASQLCNRSSAALATRSIVVALKRRGYRFVTIPELLRASART